MKKKIIIGLGILFLVVMSLSAFKNININPQHKVGQKIDSFNGVAVYYNGGVGNVSGRNLAKDGYNLGLKYQCVEFVKRYYYEALKHKMPDSYGHAKDFFDARLKDGQHSKSRNLSQFSNPSQFKPRVNDLVVYSATLVNQYGHVSIITAVGENNIEIIQQNPGPFAASRKTFELQQINGQWKIDHNDILGWLRQ